MNCLLCGRKIVLKRTLKNLFSNNYLNICEYCLKNYPIIPDYFIVPTNNGSVFVVTLLKNYYNISNYNAYMRLLEPVYLWFMKQDVSLIILDELDDEVLKFLQELYFEDILVITYKIKKGGKYEI